MGTPWNCSVNSSTGLPLFTKLFLQVRKLQREEQTRPRPLQRQSFVPPLLCPPPCPPCVFHRPLVAVPLPLPLLLPLPLPLLLPWIQQHTGLGSPTHCNTRTHTHPSGLFSLSSRQPSVLSRLSLTASGRLKAEQEVKFPLVYQLLPPDCGARLGRKLWLWLCVWEGPGATGGGPGGRCSCLTKPLDY